MSGTVSVIIPTFNRAVLLREAVQSVLDQTYRALEVIVVDDGSTDDTRESMAAWFGSDPRVRYSYQANRGASSARNAGLDLATGGYIAFLDSDDAWQPWHLQLMLECLDRRPEAGLIWTEISFVDSVGTMVLSPALKELLGAYRHFTMDELFPSSAPLAGQGVVVPVGSEDGRLYVGDVFSAMIMGNLVLASSTVMRRQRLDLTGRFDERFSMGEDYEFFLRACAAGPVAFVDVPDVRYRTGTDDKLSGTHTSLPMAKGYLRVLEEALARDSDRITLEPEKIARARAYAHRWVGTAELILGSRRMARAHIAQSLRSAPWTPSTLGLFGLTFLPSAWFQSVLRWRRSIRAAGHRGS